MKDITKDKKNLNPGVNEKINALKVKMKLLKRKARIDEEKRLNSQRIILHDLIASFASNGWPADYEAMKMNIQSIFEG